jgi:hypothetical protein
MSSGKITYGNPIRYYVDGQEVDKAKFDERFPNHPIKGHAPQALMETSKAWPRLSDAYGIGGGPGRKEAAEARMAKLGVPTEYVPDGSGGYSAVIRNNAHQRDLLKATGMHNLDGGYGSITG